MVRQRDVVARSQDFHGLYCEYFADKKNHEQKQQLLLKTFLRFSVQYIRYSSQLRTRRPLKAGQRNYEMQPFTELSTILYFWH
jgi:hypothetical protein